MNKEPMKKVQVAPMIWKETNLFVGKAKVGSVYHSAFVIKGETKRYTANCFLPGIKQQFGNYETEAEGRAIVEKAVNHFFNSIISHQDENQ